MSRSTPASPPSARVSADTTAIGEERGRLVQRAVIDILSGANETIYAYDPSFRYIYVNEPAAKVLGRAAAEIVGRTWDDVLPSERTIALKQVAAEVMRTRQPFQEEIAWRTPDGEERFFEYVLSPVLDQRGEVDFLVSIGRDTTARNHAREAERRARDRAIRLHEVASALSRASEPERIADVVITQAFETLQAEAGVAYVRADEAFGTEGSGSASFVQVAARGLSDEAAARIGTWPLDDALPLSTALRTGSPVWIASQQHLVERYPGRRARSSPNLGAVAALPFKSGDQIVGGMVFSFGRSRSFTPDDQTFLLTLAEHAGLAFERARLEATERAARDRLTILADASRKFSEAALNLDEILDTVVREVGDRLKESCVINLLSADGAVLEPVALHHVDPEAEASIRATLHAAPIRVDETSSPARVVQSGQAILVPKISLEALLASSRPEYRAHLERFQVASLLIVPLRVRDQIIGTMTVTRGAGAPSYTESDRSLLQDLADRAAMAIANARQYDELGAERRRLSMFAKVSATLAASLDYETTLAAVIDLALPTLGDFGFFDVVEASGEVRRIARAYQDARRQALLDQTRWVRSERTDKNLCALSSGKPGIHPFIDDEWLRDVAVAPAHLSLMRELAFGSMITVPLASQDRVLGALTLFFVAPGRHHTKVDLALTEELAWRAAAAVENARLFREVQQAVAVRDDFLSIAGHELNTPLTALQLQIQGLKRLANKDLLPATEPSSPISPPSRLIDRLAKTESHILRLQKLVRELLDVSRITAGGLRLEREWFDLPAAVREVIERMTPQANNAGSQVSFAAGSQSGGTIIGHWDRLRIDQVVTNLLGNAIKYGAGKPIEVGVSQAGALARLTVRDHGIGISPADEQRIFERFERAVSQRHYGGFGLGLWISRQIVEAHGGSIRFERPGEAARAPADGTCFIVELPLGGADQESRVGAGAQGRSE